MDRKNPPIATPRMTVTFWRKLVVPGEPESKIVRMIKSVLLIFHEHLVVQSFDLTNTHLTLRKNTVRNKLVRRTS